MLLVLVLRCNIDAQPKPKALRIGTLRLHGVNVLSYTGVLLKQTKDPVVAHLEMSLDQLANEGGVCGSQTVDSLSDAQSLKPKSRQKWTKLTIGEATHTQTAFRCSLETSQ
jgi:hypothetical protein